MGNEKEADWGDVLASIIKVLFYGMFALAGGALWFIFKGLPGMGKSKGKKSYFNDWGD